MSLTQHRAAVRQASRTSDQLAILFGKLGTTEHPRGGVLQAYRTARRAIKGNVDNPRIVEDTLNTLRNAVSDVTLGVFSKASEQGSVQGVRNVEAYGLRPAGSQNRGILEAQRAVRAEIDRQTAAVQGIIATSADEALIIGDSGRVGILSPAPVNNTAAQWTTSVAMLAIAGVLVGSVRADNSEDQFMRQAIAGLDERTTDCCLRVHGQVVGMDQPFKLTGTPRYADELQDPGFHWYCRTSVALVALEDVEDELTTEMREAARAELRARPTKGRVEIHPADARSRR